MLLKENCNMIHYFVARCYKVIASVLDNLISFYHKEKLGYCANDVIFRKPDTITCHKKINIGKNSHIFEHSKIIISEYGDEGKLIVKENVCIAQGLTVITGSHNRSVGRRIKENILEHYKDSNLDVVIEDDVWIGANVTLLAGVHVGRGCNIGAGSVVRNNIPPYAIVVGNPSKIIGFCFTPEEIVEHEKILYHEEERLSLSILETNYQKYFLKRLKEIKEYTKI